jgi:Tfp pilus assembly protein PilX
MNYLKRFSKINNTVFRQKNGEQGSSLIVVLVMLATMLAIAFGAIHTTQLNVTSSGAHKKGKQAFYSAEVGLDLAVNDIIQEFEDLAIYTVSENHNTNDPGNPVVTETYRGFDVQYTVTNPLAPFIYQTVAGNSTIFHFAHTYDINSTATSLTDNSVQSVQERIRILETPLVQYYIFFGGTGNNADLELLPGPVMNSWGRIHANGDIYIGTGNTLTLRNYDNFGAFSPHLVSAGGEIFGERKNDGSNYDPTNFYIRKNDNQTAYLQAPIEDSVWLDPPTNSVLPPNVFVGTIPSGELEELPDDNVTTVTESRETDDFNDYLLINEQVLSAPGQTQFWRGGFYENRAEDPQNPLIDTMRIIEGSGGGIQIWVTRPAAEDVTAEVMNLGVGTLPSGLPDIVDPVRETVGTNTLCEDREGDKWVDFTDIDLSLLHTWYLDHLTSNGLFPAGGGLLVYTSRSPHEDDGPVPFLNKGARVQAIRLINMGGSTGLQANTTVATDNPIYVQGHFNDGASGNTVRGVALVSDAINVLSSNFSTKTNCSSGLPNAAETNINAAFFGGNVPTPSGGGTYSGGLENYPRFHEDWSPGGTKVDLNILGSFINLWTSSQSDGTWVYGAPRYEAPGREWGWDVRFQNPNFWPPFIPSVFSVERVGYLDS